jgi:uncharacterized cupredoxin-like copper-binding protein
MNLGISLLAAAEGHEKSKTAFYIAGGVLAGWAVIVGVIGFTQPGFPGSPTRARAVMGLSAVLVVAAITAAVLTASSPPPAPAYTKSGVLPKGTSAPPSAPGAAAAPASAPAATSGASGVARIAADPAGQLKFVPASTTVRAGRVKLVFSNDSPVDHNLTVERSGSVLGATPTFHGGAPRTLKLSLPAGTYTLVCTVPGHQQAGMHGTLTVQ